MQQQKGSRPGIDKKNFGKLMTDGEIQRVKEQRKFDEIKPGTITHKIALHLDSLRKQYRDIDNLIAKRLWNIQDIKNNIFRLRQQLMTKNITETVKDGMTMNEQEVATLIQHQEWIKIGEVRSIPESLAEMRAIVGHKDYAGVEILSEGEYETYVQKIRDELKDMHHDIFD